MQRECSGCHRSPGKAAGDCAGSGILISWTCWGGASSASPAQDSGHTAIAPTTHPPVRSPGCGGDAAGLCVWAVFDRKGPGFLGEPGVGLRAPGPSLRPAGLMQCLPLAESLPSLWRVLPTRPSVCCASHTVWKVCHHLFVGAVGWARILGHQQRGRWGWGACPVFILQLRSLCPSLSRKLSGSLSRVSPPWAPARLPFPASAWAPHQGPR